MKLAKFKDFNFIPASHEDPKNPGVLKKVLLTNQDLVPGQIMMINWAKLPVNKSFEAHLHTKMQEVFVILSGKAKIKVGNEEAILEKGDAVVTPVNTIHQMKNIGKVAVHYIALGIAIKPGGKTVNV